MKEGGLLINDRIFLVARSLLTAKASLMAVYRKSQSAGFYEMISEPLKEKKKDGRCQLDNKIFRLDVNIIRVSSMVNLSHTVLHTVVNWQNPFRNLKNYFLPNWRKNF